MKMKTTTKGACCLPFLQCLLLGATNGCIFNEHSNKAISGNTDLCCGPSKKPEGYFPRTQICCNGTVHDREGRMCCNGELFDPTQRICCDDTLHVKENKVCCGSKLYRVTTDKAQCCGGELHNSSQGCCGGQELYNTSSQICCEFNGAFNVATKEKYCCYDKAFNAESQYCVKGQVLSFKENLCGNEIYNISEKKCCGDQTLYDMPQFLADCCGSQLFDVNKSQCCRGTKTVIPTNLECCGEGSFNESTHLCCNAVIKSKGNDSRCCGSETIDVTEGCCGAKAYILSTHHCCKNSTIIPKNQSCCGYSGYDNFTQLCTKNYKVINRPSRFSCNNGSLTKRRRVSRSICNTCLWRFRRIYREIKSGNLYVCKRHIYNITIIDTTTHRKGFWIMYAKYEKKDKMESNVEIIVPCKSKKLNKTGDYLLVTDSIIDGETLRLGDSDLLLQYHLELEDLVYRKKRTCRQVSVVLSEIRKAVNRFIWDYLRPN